MQIKKSKSQSIRANRLGRVGIFSLWGMLNVLAIVMICPSTSQSARAADVPVVSGSDSLSVSISNAVLALEADPNVNNGIALGSVTVSAKTTNETGYTTSLKASNTALESSDSSNTASVATLSSSAKPVNFPANQWGYYFGTSEGTTDTTYKQISTTATQIDATSAANSTSPRTQTLTIAAKIDDTLPADTYSTQLTVSVTGNPTASLSDITDMQEMTNSVCKLTAVGEEKQLKDTRDGKLYWVGKMKDGRCWMLQNLMLGSSDLTKKLTPSNSDVNGDWTLPTALYAPTRGDNTDDTAIQYWISGGGYILTTPEATIRCGGSDILSLSQCTQSGFKQTSDVTDYDEHYLVGYYYSWNAATAGTGGNITSGQATSSICPKGWRLPWVSSSTTAGSFGGLLSKYGVNSSLSGTVDGTTYNIAGSPLRFVRSGHIVPGNSIAGAGITGSYWSSTPASNSTAYILRFNESSVNSSSADIARRFGLPVRCINNSAI